jgi:hypothetical protein
MSTVAGAHAGGQDRCSGAPGPGHHALQTRAPAGVLQRGQVRRQCCGSGMLFFSSGSDCEGSFGSGSCMIFVKRESVSASRELHGKLALYSGNSDFF